MSATAPVAASAPHASIASLGPAIGPLIERHIDRAFRRFLRGPRCISDPRFVSLLTGEPHPFGNFTLLSEAADPPVCTTAIAPLLRGTAPSAVLCVGRPPAAVEETITRAGFEPHGVMPAMAVEIDKLPATTLPDGYTLARVGAGPQADDWAAAFSIGYELPPGVGAVFSPNVINATLDDHAEFQFYAIVRDGRIVCTSLAFLHDGVAGIYCVSTIPSERGHGLGAHATAEPLRRALAQGYRVGVLQSSPMGLSVYRRLGFAEFGAVPLYVRMGG
ncbi:MAG: hypothetical protein IPM64_01215 [Phycisphaerales bacterium]|nr:hypothetical protein [Phycisphaerales bacterium]